MVKLAINGTYLITHPVAIMGFLIVTDTSQVAYCTLLTPCMYDTVPLRTV
jgi:hypothetical protein